jgi:hypothetical protein
MAAILVAMPAVFATPSAANAPADGGTVRLTQAFDLFAGMPSLKLTQVPPTATAGQRQEAEPIRIMKPIAVPVPRPRPVDDARTASAQFKPAAKATTMPTKPTAAEPVQGAPAKAVPTRQNPPAKINAAELKKALDSTAADGRAKATGKASTGAASFVERITLVYDGLTWHLLRKEDTAHGTKNTTRLVTCGGKYAKNLKGGHYNCTPNGVGVKIDVSDITGIDGTYVGVYGFQNSFGKPVRAVLVGKKWDVLDGKVTLSLSVGYDFAQGYKSPIIAGPQVDLNLDKITGWRELEGWSITAKVSPLGLTRDSRSSVAGMIGIQYKFSNNWLKPRL